MAQAWESEDIRKQGDLYTAAQKAGNKAGMAAAKTEADRLRATQGYKTDASGLNATPLAQQQTVPQPLTTQQPAQPQINPQDYINQLKDAQISQNVAALDKAKTSSLSNIETERAKIEPAAYENRNAANVTMNNSNRAWDEFLASKGLNSSGIGATGYLTNQNQYAGQVGAINRDATNQNAELNRKVTDINNGYESDLSAAKAGANATALQNLISQYNTDREYNLNKASTDASIANTNASIANTQANTAYQNLVNAGYPKEQAAKLAQAQAELKGVQLANEAQTLANKYQPQILKGQIDEQTLKNSYQKLINEGYPKQQAMEIAVQQANINQSNASAAAALQNAATNRAELNWRKSADNPANQKVDTSTGNTVDDYSKVIESQFKTPTGNTNTNGDPTYSSTVDKTATRNYLAQLYASGVSEDIVNALASRYGIK